MSQKCKILGKGGKCQVCIPKNIGCKYDKEANVAFTMFARDLLLNCHKFVAYICREQISANSFFLPAIDSLEVSFIEQINVLKLLSIVGSSVALREYSCYKPIVCCLN